MGPQTPKFFLASRGADRRQSQVQGRLSLSAQNFRACGAFFVFLISHVFVTTYSNFDTDPPHDPTARA